MNDADKFTYQETARLEQMLHKIAHPDYQSSPSPKGTARARKPTRGAVPSQSASLPIPALPEHAELTFSQFCMCDPEVDQAHLIINTLPPSLELGTNTLLRSDTSSTMGAYLGQLGSYIHTTFPLSDPCHPAALDGISPLTLNYGLQNFNFDLDEHLLNQFLPFNQRAFASFSM